MNLLGYLAAIAIAFASSSVLAQYTDGIIRIGVAADMSSLYTDIGGPGSVTAARLAVQDFAAAAKGMKVEIISADHQNKPDLASTIVGAWTDLDKVDVILDGTSSGVGLALRRAIFPESKVERTRLGHREDGRVGRAYTRW